ncbi:MAG: hypothetical protein B1H12_04780 [Desulfobacteraceae bacterium 4484_190.2]|nr:MAG: hypothetical protein B1H12_04780 [Desulfobacteraceae bacterium 4484_190.2]
MDEKDDTGKSISACTMLPGKNFRKSSRIWPAPPRCSTWWIIGKIDEKYTEAVQWAKSAIRLASWAENRESGWKTNA